MWNFPNYSPAFIINVILTIGLAVKIWNLRSIPGVRAFTIALLASGLWSFCLLLEIGANEVWAKIFWAKVEYIGIVMVSPAWFVFAFTYTRRLKRLSPLQFLLIAAIPIITLGFVWTNELHNLIWTTITPSASDSKMLIYGHGVWFWIYFAYSYMLLITGIGALLYATILIPQQYLAQAKFLILGAVTPIIGNLIYVTGLSPIEGLDLTPFCFPITALIYFQTIFRYKLFDIRRIARDTIIEHMRDGVLILDETDHIIDLNPSALQLLDTPNKSLIGNDIRLTLSKHNPLLAAIISPKQEQATIHIEGESERYLDVQVTEIVDSQGSTSGKTVILRDVTQRQLMEKIAFETAIEQHRVQLLGQFIRDVSHEFKTPLSIINNSLYLMEKSDSAEKQEKQREIIQLQSERLQNLIGEMLTTVQLDADYPIQHDPIHLNAFLETLIQQQMSMFTAKHQRVILNLRDSVINILGDTLLLKKALINVLENANRYTPEGGTITVTNTQHEALVNIEISDTGIGMSPATQARIFERFFRADDAHSTPGFGLGLSIAQTIIKKHQGRIEVESALGTGTRITIWLPQKVDDLRSQPDLPLAPA